MAATGRDRRQTHDRQPPARRQRTSSPKTPAPASDPALLTPDGIMRTRVKAAWVLRTIATQRAERHRRWEELRRLVDAHDPSEPASAASAIAEWMAHQPDGWEADSA